MKLHVIVTLVVLAAALPVRGQADHFWQDLNRAFGGNFMMFAVWFN